MNTHVYCSTIERLVGPPSDMNRLQNITSNNPKSVSTSLHEDHAVQREVHI